MNGLCQQNAKTEQAYSTAPKPCDLVIHVFDEREKVSKDFRCDKGLLLSHMKYFEKFKTEGTTLEDLDISVHCDVKVFEWLMQYLRSPSSQQAAMDPTNVISILVSADYLQMDRLVSECINFICLHLSDIVKLPIDMNCISPPLMKRIAAAVSVEELDLQRDKRGKLVSKLYMKKLETLIDKEGNALCRCVYCNKLFTQAQKDKLVCHKADVFIDFHGNVIAQHVADRYWDIKKFVYYLRQQGQMGWREVYWKLWARMTVLRCATCDSWFVPAEMAHCSYHPQKPTFPPGGSIGVYPCCQTQTARFSAGCSRCGCAARLHMPTTGESGTDVAMLWECVTQRENVIAEPFGPGQSVMQKGRCRTGVDALPLGKIQDSPSLQGLLDEYIITALDQGDVEVVSGGESSCEDSGEEPPKEAEKREDATGPRRSLELSSENVVLVAAGIVIIGGDNTWM